MFESAPVDRNYILSRISEEEIFHKYLGIYPNLEDYFTNPLRSDTHADCKFYRDATSRRALKFKDFAGGYNIDCFNVVQILNNNCTFYKALDIIAKDFNLFGKEINKDVIADFHHKISIKRSQSIIQVQRRPWCKLDEDYWLNEGNLTRDIRTHFECAPIDFAWLGDSIIYQFNPKDPCYVYWFGNRDYKLYWPLRRQGRFLQNRGDILQGYNQLPKTGEVLIITKSFKDVMCMYRFDICAVAPMSESILITEEQYLELIERFPRIYSLMDRDRAGIRMAQQLRYEYNIEPLMFGEPLFRKKEEPKDFVEHVKYYKDQWMWNTIEETKQILLQ